MVEVFKTNVTDHYHARLLLAAIHSAHNDYTANFDLNDCDKVLRVECKAGYILASSVITVLKDFGFTAKILSDDKDYDPFEKLRRWI